MANQAIKQLTDRYKSSANEKHSVIREFRQMLARTTAVNESDLLEMKHYVHKLAGSAGMYGFDDLHCAAQTALKVCEQELKQIQEVDLDKAFQAIMVELEKLGD